MFSPQCSCSTTVSSCSAHLYMSVTELFLPARISSIILALAYYHFRRTLQLINISRWASPLYEPLSVCLCVYLKKLFISLSSPPVLSRHLPLKRVLLALYVFLYGGIRQAWGTTYHNRVRTFSYMRKKVQR